MMKTSKHTFVIETTDVAADILRETLCRAIHEGEEDAIRWLIENAVDVEHGRKPLKKMGMFATPDDVKALEHYVTKTISNPSERVVAITVMGMTWNLCAELTKEGA